MKIENVKGCKDYLPKEQIIRNYINEILKETFEEFGFLSVETPILSYYNILSGKYDEDNDLLKEIYKLSDQGKRNLGLRYDLTVPFAKFIALNKNKISFPFKRYEISKVFRDGPIKLGRDREFTQCDADIVGLSGQMIEAEVLNLYVNAFNKLNIDINIKYNSRNLMEGLIIDSGIQADLVSKTITILDKMDKVSKKELKEMLIDINLKEDQINNLLDSFSLTLKELTKKYNKTSIDKLKLGIDELNNLEEYLEYLNINSYCAFAPTLARGQDYYTGNVFEVYEKSNKISSSIGAGGRYDKMITEFIDDGNIYPAIGISFGLSSIYELLKNSELFDNYSNIDLYIIPMNTEKETLKIANELRKLGLKINIEMNKRKIKKCFEWANKNNIPYVLVIGEDEINSQIIRIKDMDKGIETEYNINDIEKIRDDINEFNKRN
ncbi:MAG: histidine--tRNA ligase [Bacilli bacterium]|nr:histidine--tRNA ligase [Bacilli bacterium]